jgi:acyl-CoA synthetase (AMP-forming)/AMP-acid ligase II
VNANIARHLDQMAAAQPATIALKIPRGRTASGDIDYLSLTFAELLAETNGWCAKMKEAGVLRGDRTLVMVKPGLPLIAAAFALFKLGAVPVIIDPGMGISNFLACVKRTRPRAVVGIPLAIFLSYVFRGTFNWVMVRVPVGSSPTARVKPTMREIEAATAEPRDLAAILFTSGSTGAPKGVSYEHGMFVAQVELIRETYGIQPGEIDLPMLPIFALFNPALGMTSIIPEIDPRHPAQADPAKIVQAIQQEKVTNSFGSPTLWRKVAAYCAENKIQLTTMKRVLCAGAPVPSDLWAAADSFLPSGTLYSPYGATEALPVSSVSADEIDVTSTTGACVGFPAAGIDVRIIPITDKPVAAVTSSSFLPVGAIGEIIVRGAVVTREYHSLPKATSAAKIPDSERPGGVWHRMGDCGLMDSAGRLWFLGRKVERVQTPEGTLYTEPCEQVFRAHPLARRCALITAHSLPCIVVETTPANKADAYRIAGELVMLGARHKHTAAIKTFYFMGQLPVDVRHNAKIHRLAVAKWAIEAKAYKVP